MKYGAVCRYLGDLNADSRHGRNEHGGPFGRLVVAVISENTLLESSWGGATCLRNAYHQNPGELPPAACCSPFANHRGLSFNSTIMFRHNFWPTLSAFYALPVLRRCPGNALRCLCIVPRCKSEPLASRASSSPSPTTDKRNSRNDGRAGPCSCPVPRRRSQTRTRSFSNLLFENERVRVWDLRLAGREHGPTRPSLRLFLCRHRRWRTRSPQCRRFALAPWHDAGRRSALPGHRRRTGSA